MKLVGVDELVLEDWDVFEAVTESWCERYFAENSAQTRVHGFKTDIRVTNQAVAPATTSSLVKTSNTLTYAQTIEYFVTNENAIIDPEDLVTAPFSGPFSNQAYLETLSTNSSAFAGIDTEEKTIPQLQESDPEGSNGSSGIIIGVVVGISVVVLLSGFAVYRWSKSQPNPEQQIQHQEPDAGIELPRRTPPSEVTPVVPVAARQPSIPVVDASDVRPMSGPTQFILQYKDQVRSVQEPDDIPFAADVTPVRTSGLDPESTPENTSL